MRNLFSEKLISFSWVHLPSACVEEKHGVSFYIEIFISFFTLHDALQAPLMRKKSVMELNAVFAGKKARNKSSCVDRPCAGYVKKVQVRQKNGQMCYISQGVRAVFAQKLCMYIKTGCYKVDNEDNSSPKYCITKSWSSQKASSRNASGHSHIFKLNFSQQITEFSIRIFNETTAQ